MLTANCRNRRTVVANLAQNFVGSIISYHKTLRPDDGFIPEIYFYSGREEQMKLLMDSLKKLESAGIKYGDVVILSMRSNRNCLAASVSEQSWKDRLKPYGNTTESNKIRYCSIYAFKGMEAPVVVITDIDTFDNPATNALLYIASTRALGQLIVLANQKGRTLMKQALDRGKLHS